MPVRSVWCCGRYRPWGLGLRCHNLRHVLFAISAQCPSPHPLRAGVVCVVCRGSGSVPTGQARSRAAGLQRHGRRTTGASGCCRCRYEWNCGAHRTRLPRLLAPDRAACGRRAGAVDNGSFVPCFASPASGSPGQFAGSTLASPRTSHLFRLKQRLLKRWEAESVSASPVPWRPA